MSYQIDILAGENWSEFANTHQKENARRIANMLLKDNYVVRISQITSGFELGDIEYPDGKVVSSKDLYNDVL